MTMEEAEMNKTDMITAVAGKADLAVPGSRREHND